MSIACNNVAVAMSSILLRDMNRNESATIARERKSDIPIKTAILFPSL